MIRNRSTRVLATLGVTVSLALTALVGPTLVLAAKPDATATATAVLAEVSPSTEAQASYIAFDMFFALDEDETSNLAQLFLLATTPGNGWDLWAVSDESREGTCDATGTDLFCAFGATDAGDDPITVRVIYKVGTATGSVTVPFLFNTTGVAGDRKGRSHGDAYQAPGSVIVENNANFGASYAQATGDVISDSTALNRNNPQYTKVISPQKDIVITVGEDTSSTSLADCQAVFGGSCFGQGSLLNVANGAAIPFQGEVGYNQNKPNAEIVHFFDPGVVDPITLLPYEELGPCGANPVAPCADVVAANGKTTVTFYLLQNGKIFGH
jgi:hypothetical protein